MDRSDETPEGLFIRLLAVDPESAAILVTNGFTTLEEIAYVPMEELASLHGLDEQRITLWRTRARRYLLLEIIDDRDEEDPLVASTTKPPKPGSGGSGADAE